GMRVMDKESEIVVSIASKFLDFISSSVPEWEEAYLRFNGDSGSTGITSTFLKGGTAHYIDADDELEFETMSELTDMFQRLQGHFPFKVCLLVLKTSKEYKIKYEQNLSDKWAITKLDGNTGIPAGYSNDLWW
ncbi:hypothetical protein, partial [Vibrio parahaemolyticus]|uniref:hypothetical protein n=2 Tax=Vibrio TaxID=662 RepID=UPI001D15FA19